ncbi:lipoprotein localization protein LolB [Vibrio sp. SCSIO 43135]|uniref:lipoprotein insertase outer membrane protein LolB n=1 Tax=Vibrio sp. SCSIO 43135 TaxID=2819096 RepID=UPI00218461F5|nr:lipoprotein insertase outer membrane protein LolB [Vibrio sp. SCSIO 43135]USD40441.1 lipoprotein localization protein LolB [Vibrio sp. SCSIO 43135]
MSFMSRLISFLVAFLILSGCSSLPESQMSVEWQAHQDKLASIETYKAVGKLGYISPQERQSLNFQWTHSQDRSQLRLTNFLGQTVLNLVITPQGAIVNTYDDQTFSDVSATQLVKRLTGLTIPVDQLQDWMRGMPTGSDSYELNVNNTLSTLNKTIANQNWQLEYLSYQDIDFNSSPLPLPQKMRLNQADTKINLVISKWTLN